MNSAKTWFLMALLTVILVLIGRFVGGAHGMLVFLVLGIAINFFSYWSSGRMAILMTRSRPASEAELPEVYAMVRRLTERANLPMPEIYITPTDQPNAFATGRNPAHAKVAVTEGILRLLPARELEGVLAHEIGHVRNRDILISSMAATLAGVISYIANALQWAVMFGFGSRDDDRDNVALEIITMIFAPIAAMMIQMAISRSREFKADATGARLVGDPNPLADALEHLEMYAHRIPNPVNPATSHLFIVNPFRGESIARLFSTHPSTAERVARLRNMRILG
ncbi:MAG: zinc metalloprotease HtpX [Alicyclobacillus mali]|uniref:zinc metalloprotease HtpX n=1 Tax=Alicyclobacillus mali (ex Roth et al. 2021) TaxID=1123961 RepID=UPI0023F00DD3|nr:zinc metalloprotease HtpX [Alicyclobacillus mali (ex Roth et al. 2021)]MCL6487350.1 zinc metalloprotease HtpX [Alicyclobacillus mali (ex Roth et al. 2021)]